MKQAPPPIRPSYRLPESAAVVRGKAQEVPLRDASVDLIVTSPPYFALRSYKDGGGHYDGQIGSESTPTAFLEALWMVTAECWRVLKASGSMWVNLGDKRAGSGGHNNSGVSSDAGEGERRNAPSRYNQEAFGRPKSKMLLPHRYAIGCEDGLADPNGIGWIVRQDQVWWKLNGLPEPHEDRTRDTHEYWFHLTKTGDYFADMSGVRESYKGVDGPKSARGPSGTNRGLAVGERGGPVGNFARTAEGRLPGSVRAMNLEPLSIPEWVGVDHYAAFPQEWPRFLIAAWCPPDGVVFDPFGGTGTTAGVARVMGRRAISLDMSADYCRLAWWRIYQSGHFGKTIGREYADAQGELFS